MTRIFTICVLLFSFVISYAQKAPDFTITDTDGNEHKLYADYLDQGTTVVIKLFFVACPLCKPYNEPFQDLYEEFGEGADSTQFFILTTRDWDSNEEIADYRTEYNLTLPGSGMDGGGYDATAPYRDGDFGTFFGTPSFIVIAPDGTVNYPVGGGGTSSTMDSIRSKVHEIQNIDSGEGKTTDINITVTSYKEDQLPEHKIYLRSKVDTSMKYEVPASFTYPSETYPELDSAEVYIDVVEKNKDNVSTFDLLLIQRHILEINTLDNYLTQAADINGDGNIKASDLLVLRKVLLNIVDGLPGKSYIALKSACENDLNECIQSIPIDTSLETQEISITVLKKGDVN